MEKKPESRNVTGIKSVAIIGSILVYVAVVIYTEYHFYNLVTQFVPGGLQVVGLIAVAASALTAIALPLAIHFWFRSGLQIILGWIFYGIHFLAMFANLILDSSIASSSEAPEFVGDIYAVYVLPGYIAFYALAWSIIWFVDSDHARIDKRREAREREEDALLDRESIVAEAKNEAVKNAFQSAGAQRAINKWAARNAPRLLAQELGLTDDELGADENFLFWMPDEKKQPSVNGSGQGSNNYPKRAIVRATAPTPPTLEEIEVTTPLHHRQDL